jgi:hypothetical protein
MKNLVSRVVTRQRIKPSAQLKTAVALWPIDHRECHDSRAPIAVPEPVRPVIEAWRRICPDSSPEALMFPTFGRGKRKGQAVARHAKNFLTWRSVRSRRSLKPTRCRRSSHEKNRQSQRWCVSAAVHREARWNLMNGDDEMVRHEFAPGEEATGLLPRRRAACRIGSVLKRKPSAGPGHSVCVGIPTS